MLYQRIAPSGKLSRFIEFHEVVEIRVPEPHFAFLSFNHPAEQGISIFYQLDGDGIHQRIDRSEGLPYQAGKIYIQSVSSRGTIHRVRGDVGYLRTFFKPGKLESFLGTPLSETTDRLLTLSDLGYQKVAELEDRIMSSHRVEDRIAHLEDHLCRQLRWATAEKELIQYLTDAIDQGRSFQDIPDLCRFFGYSARHLRRIFLDQLGISPKGFLKMFRLKQVLSVLEGRAFRSLTDLAYEFGFADQAHFCREFKNYMGLTPGSYLKRIDPSFTQKNRVDFQGWAGEMKE